MVTSRNTTPLNFQETFAHSRLFAIHDLEITQSRHFAKLIVGDFKEPVVRDYFFGSSARFRIRTLYEVINTGLQKNIPNSRHE